MSALTPFESYDLAGGIVYGPIRSRRLGRSLGINILPPNVKVCSFNCNYCQLGWTYDITDPDELAGHAWPSAAAVGEAVGRRLTELRPGGALECATLAGNGEPTLHPEFDRVVDAVLSARDRVWPGLRVGVLSNGANCARDRVVAGLDALDERYMKLDAGSESVFLDMNAPVLPIGVWDVIQGLRRLRDCTIQSMFTRGRRDNTTREAVDMWISAVAQVNPRGVHLYSVSRVPADPQVRPVDRGVLESIRAQLEAATGLAGEVF